MGRWQITFCAFDVPKVCKKLLAKNDKGQRATEAMVRTGDLGVQ